MKNNALARQPDANASSLATNHAPANAPACDEPLRHAAQHAPEPAEPERTVLRELHRMFALIAIR